MTTTSALPPTSSPTDSNGKAPVVELRDFVKESARHLYDFCLYLVPDEQGLDDLVLAIFRDFGQRFRRHRPRMDAHQARLELFGIAWTMVREVLAKRSYPWVVGRDTRHLQDWDDNLLAEWLARRDNFDWARFEPSVVQRLRQIDLDFRAPLVLKDVLAFADDDVMQLLDLRWGVYRHRLHRGRVDLRDALRGHRPGQSEKDEKDKGGGPGSGRDLRPVSV